MTNPRKKLIEVALPLEAINAASAREKSIRHGHPSTLHLWWARRPLAACRAVLFGQLVDDPSSWLDLFPTEKEQDRERDRLFRLIEELVTWENSNNETVINAARLEIARSHYRGRYASPPQPPSPSKGEGGVGPSAPPLTSAEPIREDGGITRNVHISRRKGNMARELRKTPTPAEATAWNLLRGRRCMGLKFRRQQVIAGFIVDFYCAELRLALELDGPVHDEQQQHDAARDRLLSEHGVRVVRVKNEDLSQKRLVRLLTPLLSDDPVSPALPREKKGSADEFSPPSPSEGEGGRGGEAQWFDAYDWESDEVPPEAVNRYLAEELPPVHDPFAGGGSIPLEAQRLGLRAIASDLNPVAVLINKALIEIPPKFAGMPPVNPESRKTADLRVWKGAEGLAEDVRYYGKWMRDEAFKRIGHLYPPVKITEEMAEDRPDLEPYVDKELTVIAWLWARTVASPNPACEGVHVPLVSTFWLSKKKGKEAWIEPIVDRENNTWRFEVRIGKPDDPKAVAAGTKVGRGDFRCVLSGDPIPASYVRAEGQAGRMSDRLMAIVCEGNRGRVFLSPTRSQEETARVEEPIEAPETDLPEQALGFRVQKYGIKRHRDLFTPRQITALTTFFDLVTEVRKQSNDAAFKSKIRGANSQEEGRTDHKYSDSVALYASLALSKSADLASSLCRWQSNPQHLKLANVFSRNALVMCLDFGEGNPFSSSSGNFGRQFDLVTKVVALLGEGNIGIALQEDAASSQSKHGAIVSTDPPYYDNVPYADLSDFFYIWLRSALTKIYPDLLRTVLVPKAPELIAEPFRHGGKKESESFFESGMTQAVDRIANATPSIYPTTIYYAFKQAETNEGATSSTGWETFLEAVADAGFSVVGTWPVRTERIGRMRDVGSNALASSVVLVCRKRPKDAPAITRADFRRALRRELPAALKQLQKGNIAPVDMAQASIGPGMAIFSRHSKVVEADGSEMSVRTALQLINEALDEYLVEQTGEFGPDTRFAVTWFESYGFEAGKYGEAETLAKARNVSVAGVVQSGILRSAAGKVRLLRRDELPDDWDPATDDRLTVWEATQHLIKRIEDKGEAAAARLLADLRDKAEPARELAYRLYSTCERKKWAEEARAYNGLVVAWPDLARMAAQQTPRTPVQGELL